MDADPTWALPVGNEARARAGQEVSTEAIQDAPPLPFIRFEDVKSSLHANDFVEGLLVSGAMSVMYGESNCGKTFLALDLALHVAEGREWFGRAVAAGPVLYLALEGGHGIRNRIAAYRQARGLDGARLPFAVVPQSLNLLDPARDLAAIIKTAQIIQNECSAAPALIVIDTLSRAMSGGNENDAADMTSLVAAGDHLREETGAHVMWIHHAGKDTAKGARGHSSLRAATDTEIEVIADGPVRRVEVRKQRDLEGGDVIRFVLRPVELGTNSRGKPVTSCVVREPTEGEEISEAPTRSLTGHVRSAYEVLQNTIAVEGSSGHPGTPEHIASIPSARWREQFYSSAMPGAEPEARKKALQRADKDLTQRRLIAAGGGRVWITSRTQPGQDTGHERDNRDNRDIASTSLDGTNGTHPFRGVPDVPLEGCPADVTQKGNENLSTEERVSLSSNSNPSGPDRGLPSRDCPECGKSRWWAFSTGNPRCRTCDPPSKPIADSKWYREVHP